MKEDWRTPQLLGRLLLSTLQTVNVSCFCINHSKSLLLSTYRRKKKKHPPHYSEVLCFLNVAGRNANDRQIQPDKS